MLGQVCTGRRMSCGPEDWTRGSSGDDLLVGGPLFGLHGCNEMLERGR